MVKFPKNPIFSIRTSPGDVRSGISGPIHSGAQGQLRGLRGGDWRGSEGGKPWEIHGKNPRKMGKTMETPWEKPWKSMGKAMEHYDEELYLVGDWNHGMDYDFPETVGNSNSN